jgi:hypothetical protein
MGARAAHMAVGVTWPRLHRLAPTRTADTQRGNRRSDCPRPARRPRPRSANRDMANAAVEGTAAQVSMSR